MRLPRWVLTGLSICLASLVSLAGSTSFAAEPDLLDILKRRGVISEEEYRQLKAREEKAAPGNWTVGYDKGFFLRSPGKEHELKIGFELFQQFTLLPEDSEESTNYRVRQGRVSFTGRAFNDYTFRLDLDGASDPILDQQAWVGWERFKEFKVRFGQMLVGFSAEQLWSRFNLFFLERSMVADNLTPEAQRGLFFSGDLFRDILSYSFSIANGTGRASDNNDDKDFSGRLVFRPFEDSAWKEVLPLEVGGNFDFGRQPFNSKGAQTRLFLRDNRKTIFDASTEGLRTRAGGDLFYNKDYRYGRISFLGEFIWERDEREGPVLTGRGTLPRDPDSVIRYGWHLQGGAMLLGSRKADGLELVAKVEQIDMDDSGNNGGADELKGQRLTTYGLGLNYWPIEQFRLSLNGFIFDFDQATDPASKDPFEREGTTWGLLFAIMAKF